MARTRSHRALRKGKLRKNSGPNQNEVYIQPELTTISTGFMADGQTFAHANFFPSVQVEKERGSYPVFPPGAFFRDEMKKRADNARSAGGGFDVQHQPYDTNVWAWHTLLGNQVRRNTSTDLDFAATELCSNKAMINREVQWMNAYFKAGVWSTDLTFAAGSGDPNLLAWTDAAAKPIAQLKKILRDAKKKCAGGKYRFNKVLFSEDAWDAFCEHPNVLARINNGQTPGGPAEITEQMVASWLRVGQIIVGDAIYTTSADGNPDETFDTIIPSGSILLAYAAPKPGLLQPSAGYTFNWLDPDGGGSGDFGQSMAKWYDRDTKSWKYEIEQSYGMGVVSQDLAVFVQGLLDT